MAELLWYPEPSLTSSRDLRRLKEAWKVLNPRERAVLVLRNVDQETLEEIGEKLQLTRERIRQIEQKGLRTLRRHLGIRPKEKLPDTPKQDKSEAARQEEEPFCINGKVWRY